MEILGYIVTKNKIESVLPFIQVVSSFRLINEKSKPILIIGLEEAKKHASSFSILNKKIDENVFWTFGKREKRNDYEKDIERFQEYVLNRALSNIKYYYFNVITNNFEKVKKLLKIIKNTDDKYFYCDKKMCYMYYNNYVMGVSMDMLDYMGIKRVRVYNFIKKNQKNKVFFNDFNLSYKIKKIIDNKKYVTPYFLSLNE